MAKNKHNFVFVCEVSAHESESVDYNTYVYARPSDFPGVDFGTSGYVRRHDKYICSDCGAFKLKFFVKTGDKKVLLGADILYLILKEKHHGMVITMILQILLIVMR